MKTEVKEITGWTPSVYYAESLVSCGIEDAWNTLLDYQAWNPTFVGAVVTPVSGQRSTEGEIVLIGKQLKDVKGEQLPEFFAKTIKVVPHKHICWIVYMKDGQTARNFVDFGLTETASGVKFNIYYYAQTQTSDDLLEAERAQNQEVFDLTAQKFKEFCEKKFAS